MPTAAASSSFAIPPEHLEGNRGVRFVLIDGFIAATWQIHKERRGLG